MKKYFFFTFLIAVIACLLCTPPPTHATVTGNNFGETTITAKTAIDNEVVVNAADVQDFQGVGIGTVDWMKNTEFINTLNGTNEAQVIDSPDW